MPNQVMPPSAPVEVFMEGTAVAISWYAFRTCIALDNAADALDSMLRYSILPSITLTLTQKALKACPHIIFVPDHYRDDETCRCDDPDHTEMKEWGYTWNGKSWV